MDKSLTEVLYETVKDFHEIGLVDNITMREFDKLYLATIKPLKPKEIKKLRLREKISQPVFAHLLNVSPSTVKHWEIGDKQPCGAALKLLNIVANKGLAAIL